MKKIFFKKNRQNKGFTIIETMISISLFLVIIMAGMGALLNANLLHDKSQNMRSILDNLSFVMEDMSRNIRTGYSYYCINTGSPSVSLGSSATKSGQGCWGIAFEPATGGNQWAYEIVSQTINGVTTYFIIKSTDNGSTWVQLTPNEINISGTSGFSILGAEKPLGDLQQPLVIIKLAGTITSRNVSTPFSLQTSVSQRLVDR
jgi:prepilin-type N-terminal cleavage/methylation domain-containing protein